MNRTTPNSNPNDDDDDGLQLLIKESLQRFLTEYKKGTTDFSNFTSIFSRFLNNLPDPPLEFIWFYSAVTFHSAKFTAQNNSSCSILLAKDLFQLLVSCSSSSSNAVKKIALLAPVIYELNSCLLHNRKEFVKEIEILLEVIVSYISICCGSNSQKKDELRVLNSCFSDLLHVWMIDNVGDSCRLGLFFPLVSDGIRREIIGISGFGIDYLAGIVMTEAFLLRLCFKFVLGISRVELEKELRDWAVQIMTAFQSYCFFDIILRMLLEPILPVSSLLNSKDEIILREILYDAVIKMDFSSLGPQKGDGRLRNLAITWLFVADNGIRFLRENGGQTGIISYVQCFSESPLPTNLIKWVTDQHGIQNKTSVPKVSTPLALIRWLLIVEDQGVRVFDSDTSKTYAKTIICRSRTEYGFFIPEPDSKNLVGNHFSSGYNEDKGEDKGNCDLEMVSYKDTMFFASPGILMVTATNGTRKRKEEGKGEGDKQVKLIKCDLNDYSSREKVVRSDDYDTLSSGSEMESSASDGSVVYMEQ